MIRYLLDTNVISELRKTKPVVAWIETLRAGQIFLSDVTLGELQTGVELTRRQDPAKANEIETWLSFVESTFAFVPVDGACFRESARLMAGRSSAMEVDVVIAAIARVRGFAIATRDEKDFRHLGAKIFNPFKVS